MPEINISAPDSGTTGESVRAIAPGTRLDTAHVVGDGPPSALAAADAIGGVTELAARELDAASGQWLSQAVARMRRQGRQLADLLRARQEELDHREAQQNARAAELDSQLRAARLWLDERHQDLCQRDERLLQREKDVADRLSQLSAAEVFLDNTRRAVEADARRQHEEQTARQAELAGREQTLALQAAALGAAQQEFHERRQLEGDALARATQLAVAQRESSLATVRQALAALDARRLALEQQAEALSQRARELAEQASRPSPEQAQRAAELDEQEANLDSRRHALVQAEEVIARDQAELGKWRDELGQERERLAQQARVDRRRRAEERRAAETDLERQRDSLERTSRQLDARRQALDELRGELMAISRDALETRLAAEELVAGLSTSLSAPQLATSLADGRARLADYHQLAAGKLAEREVELRKLADDLAEQSAKLSAQKNDLDCWLSRRQREFDKQTSRLAAREDELRQAEIELRAQQERFRDQRWVLENEIRRLSIRLHSR
jgi:hypothetical protein